MLFAHTAPGVSFRPGAKCVVAHALAHKERYIMKGELENGEDGWDSNPQSFRLATRVSQLAYHPRRGIVSYIIRYYFNPCGTGSHLYTANTNTLRSVHRNKDLLALVGLATPLLPCIPHLYLDYITLLVICQALFLCQVLLVTEKDLTKFSSKEIERSNGFEPHLPDCGVEPLLHQQNWVCYRLSLAPLLYPYCITTWVICQGVFTFFY